MESLNLEKHPHKTFIWRAEKGFDFLGYHFATDGLGVAEKTLENFVNHATRLYEQEPGVPLGNSRLGLYVRRWLCWVTAGWAVPLTCLLIRALASEETETSDCGSK